MIKFGGESGHGAMTDIVERLRAHPDHVLGVIQDAADEIERLRGLLNGGRKPLEHFRQGTIERCALVAENFVGANFPIEVRSTCELLAAAIRALKDKPTIDTPDGQGLNIHD